MTGEALSGPMAKGIATRTRKRTVLVTGYAKAPQGTSMYEQYKHAGIVLEIDPVTNVIVDAEFTFVTDLAQRFFKEIVAGYCLDGGLEGLLAEINARYLAPSSLAVVAALKSALQRYFEHREALSQNSYEGENFLLDKKDFGGSHRI